MSTAGSGQLVGVLAERALGAGHGDPVDDLDVADPGGHRAAERVGQPDPDLEVAGVGGVVAEQHEVVRAPLGLVGPDHGRDLGGHVASGP